MNSRQWCWGKSKVKKINNPRGFNYNKLQIEADKDQRKSAASASQ